MFDRCRALARLQGRDFPSLFAQPEIRSRRHQQLGVDEQIAVVLHHAGGGLGVVKAAIRVGLSCTARISGTDGAIELPAFMHCPQQLVVRGEIVDAGFEGEGLRFQIDEVHRCLAAGAVESATMPLEETLRLATTMDRIRRSVGVRYPGEG